MREGPVLEAELADRLKASRGERAIGVTDLLSLRRAFYRLAGPPVPIAPARQARRDQGRAFHRTLGGRLASEGILEARVRRHGLVGRIDILSDVPVEVKTASTLIEPGEIGTDRPDHIEQLGMYCALVDQPAGRLLTLVPGPEGVAEVQAVDITFGSPRRIFSEMQHRASLLREAWTEGRADRLPRCPWYGRGCEFQEASVCACTGREEPHPPALAEEVVSVTRRDEVGERIRSALREPLLPEEGEPVERYREIVYPRRAYFERTVPAPMPAPAPTPAAPVARPPPDLYARLTEALESGPAGEVARVPARSIEPEEEVVGFRGRPYLLRTTRAWSRYAPDELVTRAPQYALELGLRCAVTGTENGFVVLGYERGLSDRDRVQVLELGFPSRTPFSRLYRERSHDLAEALRNRAPERLPPCPEWMVPNCPYRSECGCRPVETRVTR